jgi:tetratricopeptide (TPR) repeat protein
MDDLHGVGQTLTRFARTELDAGQFQRASAHLTQALDVSRRIGARPVETVALNCLGEAARLSGHQDLACGRHSAALDLTDQTGDLDERAQAHHGLALAHAALGHLAEAQRHAREAFAGYLDLGVPEAEEVRARFSSLMAGCGTGIAYAR